MEGYTITEADKDDVGTEIILVLKDDTDSENYSEYLDDYHHRQPCQEIQRLHPLPHHDVS